MLPQAASDPPLSSLIFSTASTNFSHTLTSLSASKNSLRSRLRSIRQDASFVLSLPHAFGLAETLPLVANARAGNWYISTSRIAASVYFKSTDGHHLNWSLSTRRLNLHLLSILGQHGTVMVVDATRRGKVMPDALSKTIPIWIAVINRVLFADAPKSHPLVTSPQAVGASEHAQIEECLPKFEERLHSLALDWQKLRQQLRSPIRAVFASPDMKMPFLEDLYDGWNVLILVSASELEKSDSDSGYVQGAADDAEHWALGLTPQLFWDNEQYLLDEAIGEAETERRAVEIVKNSQAVGHVGTVHTDGSGRLQPAYFRPSPTSPPFYVMKLDQVDSVSSAEVDIRIMCFPEPPPGCTDVADPEANAVPIKGVPATLKLHCPRGKLGSRFLRSLLPRVASFVIDTCRARHLHQPRILLACETGKDISVGVALAMVCCLWDRKGDFILQTQDTGSFGHTGEGDYRQEQQDQRRDAAVDKTYIRQRLVQIQSQVALEDGGPSRSTLTAVNSFLMERPD